MTYTVDGLRDTDGLERSIRTFENWLGGAVSGGMDVDFLCERKGHFLFIEGKPWQNGVAMGFGQHKTLLELSHQPQTTVLLVGEAKDSLFLYEYGNGMPNVSRSRDSRLIAFFWPTMFGESSVKGLRAYVKRWWSDASRA